MHARNSGTISRKGCLRLLFTLYVVSLEEVRLRHVLLVDDDEDVRTMLHTGLQASGFRVSSASQARDALALADLDRPDAVLTDVGMPGMSGIDLAFQIVQKNIPLLLITGIREAKHPPRRPPAGLTS